MKIFTKLFLSILLILTVTLTAVHYFTVNESFESNLQLELDAALKQHQLVKYALTSDIQTASSVTNINKERIMYIARLTESNFGTYVSLDSDLDDVDTDNGNIKYSIEEIDGSKTIRVESILNTDYGD